ncbi:MAG: outer membrane beta-barrel protein [Bacteroidota bacterium]
MTAEGRLGLDQRDRSRLLLAATTLYPTDQQLRIVDSLHQQQLDEERQDNYFLQLSYTEPLGKHTFLRTQWNRRNFNHSSTRNFFDLMDGGQTAIRNELLSNLYQQDYRYDQAGLRLQHNRKAWQASAALNWQHAQLGGSLASELQPLSRSFNFSLPAARLRYKFKNSRSLSLNYRTATQEPSIAQLQPIVNNTDPLNIYQGNPELAPEYQHNLDLQFQEFNQFSFISLFAGISGSYTNNKITTAQSIDSLFRRSSMPINVAYDQNVRTYANFSAPLPFGKLKFNINASANFNKSLVVINDLQDAVQRRNGTFSVSVENRKKEKIDWLFGGSLGYNQTRFDISEDRNQNFNTPAWFAELRVPMGERWELFSSFDYSIYPNADAFGERLEVPIWEASVSVLLLKDKKLRLTLAAFDLLNQNLGVSRNSNFNYLEEVRIRSLGRYLMLKSAYSLSGFGGAKMVSVKRLR